MNKLASGDSSIATDLCWIRQLSYEQWCSIETKGQAETNYKDRCEPFMLWEDDGSIRIPLAPMNVWMSFARACKIAPANMIHEPMKSVGRRPTLSEMYGVSGRA